ncbi:DUF5320 domain-containing protein [bacterium]|nr:DUF5320 domain-containing protein [bacterium]
MPRGDGTGPMGKGAGTGVGKAKGSGGGGGQGQVKGGGRGRMGGFVGGPGGNCVCSACGEKLPHQQGTPCTQLKCPKCGSLMTREF